MSEKYSVGTTFYFHSIIEDGIKCEICDGEAKLKAKIKIKGKTKEILVNCPDCKGKGSLDSTEISTFSIDEIEIKKTILTEKIVYYISNSNEVEYLEITDAYDESLGAGFTEKQLESCLKSQELFLTLEDAMKHPYKFYDE